MPARGRGHRFGKYCFSEYAMYIFHPRYVPRIRENKEDLHDSTTFNGELYAVTLPIDGDTGSSRIL